MIRAPCTVIIVTLAIISSSARAGTIHGYVVDTNGRRVQGARVEASQTFSTDQEWHRPHGTIQRDKLLAATITDSQGNFTLSGVSRDVNIVDAEFDHQAGVAPPSFTRTVRIVLHQLPPRPGWVKR